MKVFRNATGLRRIKNPVVTLGNFDGVHSGHARILKRLVERARRLRTSSVVYTFEPHPQKVVAPHKSPPLIAGLAEKKRLIEGYGVDCLVLARFTKEFASKHPREFVEEVLVKGLSAKEVLVGHDFSFGKGKAGTVEYLRELGREFGFNVSVVPAYSKGGAIVSSSRIRSLVLEGKVGEAAKLLGRRFSISGRVVRGRAIGRDIGFPTANVSVTSELVPGNGVYAALVLFDGVRRGAVVNIGTAPTFGGKEKTVEAHVIGFRGDIYGRRIEVVFLRRLRSEKAFPSKDALVRQIGKDLARAKGIIKKAKGKP